MLMVHQLVNLAIALKCQENYVLFPENFSELEEGILSCLVNIYAQTSVPKNKMTISGLISINHNMQKLVRRVGGSTAFQLIQQMSNKQPELEIVEKVGKAVITRMDSY